MARGFESKSVADQQEESQRERERENDVVADPAKIARRRKLELAREDVKHRLDAATAEGHREMLRRALAALDKDLAALD